MRRFVTLAGSLALTALLLVPQSAVADRQVARFATLPEGQPGHPEGIAADAAGNIYAASFEFVPNNRIYVFGRNGKLKDTIDLSGHVPLGMRFGPDGLLYVADFGNGKVLQLTGHTISKSFQVCGGPSANCALNDVAFDALGLLHVSDSFGGRIFTVNTMTGLPGPTIQDERLKPAQDPHGFPPFGANGLAFKGSDLFVANTADDRILKISNPHTSAQQISTFTESINGADGIAFDSAGRLWVCANQENVLYVLDGQGRVLDIIGGFEGIDEDGAVRGLLFPASIVQSGKNMFITNAALELRHHFAGETPVTQFTVSRVRVNPEEKDKD